MNMETKHLRKVERLSREVKEEPKGSLSWKEAVKKLEKELRGEDDN